jgi:hypothetical protein
VQIAIVCVRIEEVKKQGWLTSSSGEILKGALGEFLGGKLGQIGTTTTAVVCLIPTLSVELPLWAFGLPVVYLLVLLYLVRRLQDRQRLRETELQDSIRRLEMETATLMVVSSGREAAIRAQVSSLESDIRALGSSLTDATVRESEQRSSLDESVGRESRLEAKARRLESEVAALGELSAKVSDLEAETLRLRTRLAKVKTLATLEAKLREKAHRRLATNSLNHKRVMMGLERKAIKEAKLKRKAQSLVKRLKTRLELAQSPKLGRRRKPNNQKGHSRNGNVASD